MTGPDDKIVVTVSYVDKRDKRWYGQDYGLCEGFKDLSKVKEGVLAMLESLRKDYNARHQGEDTGWA